MLISDLATWEAAKCMVFFFKQPAKVYYPNDTLSIMQENFIYKETEREISSEIAIRRNEALQENSIINFSTCTALKESRAG